SLGEIAVLQNIGSATMPGTSTRRTTNTWLVPKVAADQITLDGRADDWPKERHNGFALAYDDRRLYLLYEARGEAAAFDNPGTNVNELFFTGEALDLELQTRPGLNPNRSQPDLGDLRLIFALSNGHPVCVLYEYRVDDLLVQPTPFRSPGRTVACDRVRVLSD